MNVIGVEGYLGAGKTLGATLIGKAYQQRSGCALYSNYGVTGSKPFASMDDFYEIAKEDSSILLLDEAHIDLDARSFNTNSVKFFSQVSYYLRKLRCTLIFTSPNFDDIDSRIRGITNMLIQIEPSSDRFIYHMWDYQSGKLFKTKSILKEDAFMIAPTLFDTYSIVTQVEVPETRKDFKEYLERLNQFHTEYHLSLKGGEQDGYASSTAG